MRATKWKGQSTDQFCPSICDLLNGAWTSINSFRNPLCRYRRESKRRGSGHAMAVECVWIVRVKPGAGGDAAYARYSKQRALLKHGWRSMVLVMVTKSAATAGNAPFRGSISKAVQRVAATQAKVAVRAAKEKNARAIADVWAAIAERKQNREQEGGQTKEAEPKATERRQDDGTEMSIADVQAATAAQKRKREVDIAETQEAEQRAKQRKDGTDKAREGQTDLQAKEKEGAKPSEKATVPAKEGKATQKRNLCEYICPHCSESVTSTVRTGRVNHRRRCGNRFPVKDGRIVAKAYVYVCPFCIGEILSNTKTGQIDHRTVCGNQFHVKDGRVSRERRGAVPTRARCVNPEPPKALN